MKHLTLALLMAAPLPAAAQIMDIPSEVFVKTVASSNTFEIQSSELAQQKATDPALKDFAAQMITDHQKAAEGLKAAAGDIPVPTELAPKHAGMVALLDGAEGAEFDRLYKDMQALAHAEAVSLFQTFAQGGDDADLKAFAAETLPTLEQHKAHVAELVAKP